MFEGLTRTEIGTPGARIHLRQGATRAAIYVPEEAPGETFRSIGISPAALRAGGGDRLRPGRGGLLGSFFGKDRTLEPIGVTE
jgi:hypothetical protein